MNNNGANNFLLKIQCSTGERYMIVVHPNSIIDHVIDKIKAEFSKHSSSRAFIQISKITDDKQFCVHESFYSSYPISTFFKSGDVIKVENLYIAPASIAPLTQEFPIKNTTVFPTFESSEEDDFPIFTNPSVKRTRDIFTDEDTSSGNDEKIQKKQVKKKIKKTPFEELKQWLIENYKGKEFKGEKLDTFWYMYKKLEQQEKAEIVKLFSEKSIF
eukprot:gene10996-3702_t